MSKNMSDRELGNSLLSKRSTGEKRTDTLNQNLSRDMDFTFHIDIGNTDN